MLRESCGEGVEARLLTCLYGKTNSSTTTCHEMKCFLLFGWKHLYPLWLLLYPTKMQGTILRSNLLSRVSQV